ncbi:MAG: glycosyltransferase family 2 protein [Chloroflexi bacterium]|nr:glycosyltransferase family 2 protein [Chloroflexota bacterium]
MTPTVSIIIPAHNQAPYLGQALRSVQAQTWADWEAIVVDDGSTDNTRDVATSVVDARIRYVYQANQGLSGARNTGVRAAGGEYLAFLDSDDEFEPEFLQVCVGALQTDRTLAAVHTATRFIDPCGQSLPQTNIQALSGEALQRQLRRGGFFSAGSVLVRADCLREAGLFDTSLTSLEDWDVWLRLVQRNSMRGLPQPLTRYRVYPGSMSTNAPRMLANRLAVIAKHVGAPDGDPAGWPADRREMVGYAYRASAFEHLQQHQTEAAWALLDQAVAAWPPLLDELDTFYELACGDQDKGCRGEAVSLDIECNGCALLEWLDDLFLRTPALRARRRTTYGNAYLALAMLNDQAGHWGPARRNLRQAITANPRLLGSPSIVRRLLKLLAGQRLRRLIRSNARGID